MIVGVDIDDTLNELSASIAKALAKERGEDEQEVCDFLREHFYIEKYIPEWTKKDVGAFFGRNPEIFSGAEVKPYLNWMLPAMRQRNFKLKVLTHRTIRYDVPKSTRQWFIDNDIEEFFSEFHHSVDEDGQIDKYEYAKDHDLKLDVMVEDKLDVAKSFLRHRIPVVLFNYPHNQGYDHPLLHRVDNWWEAYQRLCTIQNESQEWLKP